MVQDSTTDLLQGLATCLSAFGSGQIEIAFQYCDYRALLVQRVGAEKVEQMIGRYQELLAENPDPDVIAEKIQNDPQDPDVSELARAFLKLLLLGVWFQPFDYSGAGETFATDDPPVVPSVQAYEQSLIWRVMQTHPTGISLDRHFGSWANKPPPLEEYLK